MALSTALGCGRELKGIAMLENGSKVRQPGLESISKQKQVDIKALSSTLLNMEKELKSFSLEICIKDIM